MTILVIGGTGTLGRQIVRSALEKGYEVRCLTRNIRKASFLKSWGAEIIYGDLFIPETLPKAFKNISVVIDASTLRAEEGGGAILDLDLKAKIALLKIAKLAQVDRFISFSLFEQSCENTIPLIRFKAKIEFLVLALNIPYTIFKLPSFYQGLIAQYAIPVLDNEPMWLIDEKQAIPYMDVQDAAALVIRSLVLPESKNLIITLSGTQRWFSRDIIALVESLSGQKAKFRYLPTWLFNFITSCLSIFLYLWPIQDRLVFSDFLNSDIALSCSNNVNDDVHLLKYNKKDLLVLKVYLQEYFEVMLAKLRDLNYNKEQFAKRKDLTF